MENIKTRLAEVLREAAAVLTYGFPPRSRLTARSSLIGELDRLALELEQPSDDLSLDEALLKRITDAYAARYDVPAGYAANDIVGEVVRLIEAVPAQQAGELPEIDVLEIFDQFGVQGLSVGMKLNIAHAIRAALAAPHPAQQVGPQDCGCCHGTGRMVRDPDIGTDQECFACDGTGLSDAINPAAPHPAQHGECIAAAHEFGSIRDYAEFREDLERLSKPGIDKKTLRAIRNGICDTIDRRVANAMTAARAAAPHPVSQQVGCEGSDGLLRVHSESETCDVCAPPPVSDSAAQTTLAENIRTALAAAVTEKYDECKWEEFLNVFDQNLLEAALATQSQAQPEKKNPADAEAEGEAVLGEIVAPAQAVPHDTLRAMRRAIPALAYAAERAPEIYQEAYEALDQAIERAVATTTDQPEQAQPVSDSGADALTLAKQYAWDFAQHCQHNTDATKAAADASLAALTAAIATQSQAQPGDGE